MSSKSQFRDVHEAEHGILLSSCSQRGPIPHGILIRLGSLAWKGQRACEAEQEHPPLKIYKQYILLAVFSIVVSLLVLPISNCD